MYCEAFKNVSVAKTNGESRPKRRDNSFFKVIAQVNNYEVLCGRHESVPPGADS